MRLTIAALLFLLVTASGCDMFGPAFETKLTLTNATAGLHLEVLSVPARGQQEQFSLDPRDYTVLSFDADIDDYDVCVTVQATGTDSLGNIVSAGSTSRKFTVDDDDDRSFSWNIEEDDLKRTRDCGGFSLL